MSDILIEWRGKSHSIQGARVFPLARLVVPPPQGSELKLLRREALPSRRTSSEDRPKRKWLLAFGDILPTIVEDYHASCSQIPQRNLILQGTEARGLLPKIGWAMYLENN